MGSSGYKTRDMHIHRCYRDRVPGCGLGPRLPTASEGPSQCRPSLLLIVCLLLCFFSTAKGLVNMLPSWTGASRRGGNNTSTPSATAPASEKTTRIRSLHTTGVWSHRHKPMTAGTSLLLPTAHFLGSQLLVELLRVWGSRRRPRCVWQVSNRNRSL